MKSLKAAILAMLSQPMGELRIKIRDLKLTRVEPDSY